MQTPFHNKLYLLPATIATGILVAACASIGRPEGGPRDETPPKFASSTPAPDSRRVTSGRVNIYFDENIQLDNPGEKVVISPTPIQQPSVSSNGRRVTVEFRDTLQPNTTYTIDLADAVKDLNEGNILDGFAMAFSTGDTIDTLCISGMVLEARTLEPAQGMLVGVYSTAADSAITSLSFERIAKTNMLGQFTVRNLRPGKYQIFALKDMNRDFHWDITEDIAFYDSLISPSTTTEEVTDTFADINGEDSLVIRQATRYIPDDVLLTWFNEDYKAQYLQDHSRTDRRILSIGMAAPADSLPVLTVISACGDTTRRIPLDKSSMLSRSATNDTLNYWLTDTALINCDSLLVETRYRRTDTLQELAWATDTLKFFMKRARGKKAREAEARRHVRTFQEKVDSVLAISDTIAIDTFALMQPDSWLSFTIQGSGSQDIHKPMYFSSDQPLKRINDNAVRLEFTTDSIWKPVTGTQPRITPADSTSLLSFRLEHQWRPETKYRLAVDSIGLEGIYGVYNKPILQEFTTKSLDDYSTIYFNITGIDSIPAIVELLSPSEDIIATAKVDDSGKAVLRFISPGTYYARMFLDMDNNGKYTTGNLLQRIQPEPTFYFHKKINLKKNWDLEQTWDIYELPLDCLKPAEIKKNKPRAKKGENSDYQNEDEEEIPEFGTGIFGSQPY